MIVEVVQGRTLLRFSGEGVAGWDTLGSAGLRGGAVFQPDFSGKTRNRQLLLLPEIVISTPTSHTMPYIHHVSLKSIYSELISI